MKKIKALPESSFLKLFFGSIEAEVMEAGLTYFRITSLAFPFIALYCTSAAVFRSMGNSRMSMRASLLMNVINVVLNFLLIFPCRTVEVFGMTLRLWSLQKRSAQTN